jgi:hypothetical protein
MFLPTKIGISSSSGLSLLLGVNVNACSTIFFTFVVSSSTVRFIRRFPTDFVKFNKFLSFITRISEIERRRRANLEDKMKKAEELEKARLKRLEDDTNAILDWGLWQP